MQARVFVLTDGMGRVIGINSEIFLKDLTNWVQVDEGEGDRYTHAQGNYLSDSLWTVEGILRYKLKNGVVVERTKKEMDADRALHSGEMGGAEDE